MLFKSKKKKRPIDIFSNIKKPHLEEFYVKFPGKKLKVTSKKRGIEYVSPDMLLIKKLQKEYGTKRTDIHTHPMGGPIPSHSDLATFLVQDKVKTSIIVPFDRKTKQPQGYFVMKKNKDFKLSESDHDKLYDSIKDYYHEGLSTDSLKDRALSLRKLTKEYNFSYRFFPVKGAELIEEAQGFKSSRQPLEAKMAIISLIFLSSSILFSLSSITGNVISESLNNSTNTISIGLFFVGLCFAGLVFFSKKILPKS